MYNLVLTTSYKQMRDGKFERSLLETGSLDLATNCFNYYRLNFTRQFEKLNRTNLVNLVLTDNETGEIIHKLEKSQTGITLVK